MRSTIAFAVLTIAWLAAGCDGQSSQDPAQPQAAGARTAAQPVGAALYAASPVVASPDRATRPAPAAADPLLVPDCHLAVIDKEDIPSQRDGVLLVVGTPLQPGEEAPPDRVFTLRLGSEEKKFRRLKEDDTVQAGQVVAQLDDRMARDDWAIKDARVNAARADLAATEKTRDEAKNRYDTETKMAEKAPGVTSAQDIRATKLAWDRYTCEADSKREALRLAELERNQAQTVLEMHQLRSSIPGVVKTIYKRPGEAVKSYEPVLQVHDLARLRVEGLVEGHAFSRLHKGMTVVLEPADAKGPDLTLTGHLQEVTAVAVAGGPGTAKVVSASEDGSVRVWDRAAPHGCRILRHPAPVRAVACTPPGAAATWCLSGAADGTARLWDLQANAASPLRELKGQHHGAVTCVAFSPDGTLCATGGDDRAICLWEAASGRLLYRLPDAHRGALTSLQFTPQATMVSAGCDNTLRLWTLGRQGAYLDITMDRRSGDVTCLGVSRDGKRALFDQGKLLRLLSLPDCLTAGVLQAASGAANFTTFALFSPDASLVLTAGASEGRLQMWRTPGGADRGHELYQLVAPDRAPATCAAFAPDGSFVVTGTRDGRVLVWPVAARHEIDRRLTARVTLVERSVESTDGQVRIWAELPNPDGRLLPGTTVTMVLYPRP